MREKSHDRLLDSAIRAYNEENQQKKDWEREAHFWHGRALKAEFINAMVPWVFLGIMVALVLVAYFWRV